MLSNTSLRTWLITAMCLVAILPAMSLAYLLADRSAEQRTERAAERMGRVASFLGRSVAGLVDKHRTSIEQLAQTVATSAEFGRDDRQRQLLAYHSRYIDFSTTLSTDANGELVALTKSGANGPENGRTPGASPIENTFSIRSALSNPTSPKRCAPKASTGE